MRIKSSYILSTELKRLIGKIILFSIVTNGGDNTKTILCLRAKRNNQMITHWIIRRECLKQVWLIMISMFSIMFQSYHKSLFLIF